MVGASVSETPPGQFLYAYQAANLLSSGTYLSEFILQNYAKDTRPYEVNPGLVFPEPEKAGVRPAICDS